MSKLVYIVAIIFAIFAHSETLDEAGDRSGSVLGNLSIANSLKTGNTYTITWSIFSYLDVDSTIVINYPQNNNTRVNGTRISRVKSNYQIGDKYSYEHKFTANLTVPNNINSGDASVGFYVYLHNDSDPKSMFALIPAGVVDRPLGLQGKQFSISISAGNNNSYYLDLPFSGGYSITQGNNDLAHSHRDHGTWDNTYAIDFATPLDTEILAPADGEIVCLYDENNNGGQACGFKAKNGCLVGGRVMVMRDNNDNYLTFLHLNSFSASLGDTVSRGDIIAYSGRSRSKKVGDNCSDTAATHLHFHLWSGNGTPDSHTTAFTEATRLRVRIDNNPTTQYLYGDDLDDKSIYTKTFNSLQ